MTYKGPADKDLTLDSKREASFPTHPAGLWEFSPWAAPAPPTCSAPFIQQAALLAPVTRERDQAPGQAPGQSAGPCPGIYCRKARHAAPSRARVKWFVETPRGMKAHTEPVKQQVKNSPQVEATAVSTQGTGSCQTLCAER